MPVQRQLRLALAGISLTIAGVLGSAGLSQAAPPAGQVNFNAPALFPRYGPQIEDYVVRCRDAPVTAQAHSSGGWQVAIAGGPFRSGDFSHTVPLRSGRAFVVVARKGSELFRYHVRCLPNSFPTYTFTRYGPVSPDYFAIGRSDLRYGMIFDNHGVPIWWVRAPGWGIRCSPLEMSSGTTVLPSVSRSISWMAVSSEPSSRLANIPTATIFSSSPMATT